MSILQNKIFSLITIRRKSAFGLVKDWPSKPKATAATTSVVYFADNWGEKLCKDYHNSSISCEFWITSLTSNSIVADSGPPSTYSSIVFAMLLMYGMAIRILPGTKSGVSWARVVFHSSPGTKNGLTEIKGSSCK